MPVQYRDMSQVVDQGYIRTYTGRTFSPLHPDPEDICIEDIAHALSQLNRWGGHTAEPYSVAEHSIRVAHLLPDELKLYGLLHDAPEAYGLVDLPRPVKYLPGMEYYRELCERVEQTIFERFGLSWPAPPEVKVADRILLKTEARDLFSPPRDLSNIPHDPLPESIGPCLPPYVAERHFLYLFRLWGGDA